MRTNYANGDEIGLACGCDGCNPSMVNGTLCHERGCPDAWRDRENECKECGCDFRPTERGQWYCEQCAAPADEYWFDQDCYG
jgi:hypothetical protein